MLNLQKFHWKETGKIKYSESFSSLTLGIAEKTHHNLVTQYLSQQTETFLSFTIYEAQEVSSLWSLGLRFSKNNVTRHFGFISYKIISRAYLTLSHFPVSDPRESIN